MENGQFEYRNAEKEQSSSMVGLSEEEKNEVNIFQNTVDTFQKDQQIFLLNNLLMSVQFFENYERDIQILRGNWYKEIALDDHHKKCFYADSLFRLLTKHVKFLPHHGINKDVETSLHPLRIFISDDNVEAAFDPAALKPSNVTPFYQLTVRPCEENKKDKSGYVSLVEFKTYDDQMSSGNPSTTGGLGSRQTLDVARMYDSTGRQSIGTRLRRKSTFDLKSARRLTKTEKSIAFQNKNPVKLENRKSLAGSLWIMNTDDTIPNGGFYEYVKPEARLKPKLLHDFRMHGIPETSHRIPRRCFQTVDVKKLKRRIGDPCFTTQIFLNSAALKAHFCDVLIEKLAAPLKFDDDILYGGTIHEEFVTVDLHVQICITPTVKIKDWNKFIEINKSQKNDKKFKELEWPTVHMRQILRVLPCYAVPQGYVQHLKENVDFEKEWKLVFPKAEEFLLLHMMHAHLRCYFFVLAIYKSFIEPETNSASFGPKHLLHIFLWRVHNNFLAWPDDRLGEVLLNFLKITYKKLQNKYLSDFFITPRNLFAESHPKDLHKAQTIIKRILENPVPYVMRALKNLEMKPSFYPIIDILKLNSTLKSIKTVKKGFKTSEKKKKTKTVRFEDDKEQQWKRAAIKQIQLEKKLEEEKRLDEPSIDSISLKEILPNQSANSSQGRGVLEILISHFLEMGIKSTEYEALDQALLYLYQIQKLLELFPGGKSAKEDWEGIKEKINKLSENCGKLKLSRLLKQKEEIKRQKEKKLQKDVKKPNAPAGPNSIEIIEPMENGSESDGETSDIDEEYETKL